MKKTRLLSVFVAVVMILSVTMLGGVEAYASSVSKPSVTLSNSSATSVKVKWGKVNGAKKYTVYKSLKKSSGYKAVKTTSSTSYTASKLTCGKTYYFKVKAVNGKKSATSAVKSIKVKPVKVSSVKAEAGCTFIKLSWGKSSGASGYEVYSSSSKSGTYKKEKAVSSTSFNSKGIKFNTKKYYKVRAYKTVNGKKVYGDFSSVVSGRTAVSHEPASSWKITQKASCNQKGKRVNTCAYCGKEITEIIPENDEHIYVKEIIPATETNCPYSKFTCTNCGDVYETEIKKHKLSKEITEPSCTKKGEVVYTCSRSECKYEYSEELSMLPHNYVEVEVKATCTEPSRIALQCTGCGEYSPDSEYIPVGDPLGHTYSEKFTLSEEGYRVYICSVCQSEEEPKIDYTCYIDLTNRTISVPAVASFGSSASAEEGQINRLDLTPDELTTSYEITGSAENLTIDVNADRDVDIKLNNANINNINGDCFDIKNKSDDEETKPEVSISVKDSTVNELNTSESGNAIETACKLVIKGHGTLNMDTASTTINAGAKVVIKNATISITSRKRGIDTESTVVVVNTVGEEVATTDYSNVEIQPNANISITATDDGIRCKNMEITELGENDVATVLNISSEADGIQLEGSNGFHAYSGDITIKAGKYAFNCKKKKASVVFDEGVAKSYSGDAGDIRIKE